MNDRTKTGVEILQASILLGILGNLLLREVPWGLNVFLFVTAFVTAAGTLIIRRKREIWNTRNAALLGAMVFFSAMFVWRDSIQLKLLNTLAIFTILAVLTLPALKIKTQVAGLIHYV